MKVNEEQPLLFRSSWPRRLCPENVSLACLASCPVTHTEREQAMPSECGVNEWTRLRSYLPFFTFTVWLTSYKRRKGKVCEDLKGMRVYLVRG